MQSQFIAGFEQVGHNWMLIVRIFRAPKLQFGAKSTYAAILTTRSLIFV